MADPLRELTTGLEGIEDAILAALGADATIAAAVRTLASWQGSVEDATKDALLRDPSILVLFAGAEAEPMGHHTQLRTEWHLLVRDRNLRGNQPRRQPGAAGETGTYALVGHVLRVLTGQDLGLDGVEGFGPLGIQLLQTGRDPSKHTSAYLVAFEARADLMAVAPALELVEVVTTLSVANTDESDGSTDWLDVDGPVITLES